MKKAIILYGPSGAGKSTLARKIGEKYDFKHCTVDDFKFIFSKKRSKLRSRIGDIMAVNYVKELMNLNENMVLEAINKKYLNLLKKLLKKNNYDIIEVSLVASLEKCLKNDAERKKKRYGSKVTKEVYGKLRSKKGYVIDTERKTSRQVFNMVQKKYFE